jgi:hypothetical protein
MNHRAILEQLESRNFFSVVVPMDISDMSDVAVLYAAPRTATVKPLTSAFNATGKFTKPLGNPDSGTQYNFTGGGKTKSLGNFTLTSHLSGPGFVANGRYTGQIVLTNSKGKITLSVAGPHQAPGPLPGTLSYSIARGTGLYAHSSGKGTISVSASNATHKFVFTFRPA